MPHFTAVNETTTNLPVDANNDRRRVRLTTCSTSISNAIIMGYHDLSDGAKMTYLALESYDWPDESGMSKGKVWPSIETLARGRGKSYDTIMRHLKELEAAGLITIESGRHKGMPSTYWLNSPTQENTAQPTVNTSNTATPPRNNAAGGSANLPDHEEHEPEKLNNKKIESKDSTGFFAGVSAKAIVKKSKPTAKQSHNLAYISRLMDDFSRSLNDQPHAASNRAQAQNLFRNSGLSEETFVKLLYEAKKRTQWAALASSSTNCPNRAPYFFHVLRDLLTASQSSN